MKLSTKNKLLFLIIIILILIGVLLIVFSNRISTRLVYLLTYSILCLLFGLIFYTFTGENEASVEFKIKDLLMKLGGGAAIGIVVIILLTNFVIKPPFDEKILPYQLDRKYYNELTTIVDKSMNIVDIYNSKRANYILIEFTNSEDGWIIVSLPNITEKSIEEYKIILKRDASVAYIGVENEK